MNIERPTIEEGRDQAPVGGSEPPSDAEETAPGRPTRTVGSEFAALTPRQVVAELNQYVIGQDEAKKAVAIALRNRWRRQNVDPELRDEILPNNIIMIGPTGVGKTEIARRLARLAGAPFLKVEASKFTEVGYVGRDVESMIRDLVEISVNMVRTEREEECRDAAAERVEERILDLLLPPVAAGATDSRREEATAGRMFVVGTTGAPREEAPGEGVADTGESRRHRTREKLRGLLRTGKLEEREVEVDVTESVFPVMTTMGAEGLEWNFTEMLQEMLPRRTRRRKVSVADARRILLSEELDKLIDMDEVVDEAIYRAENMGIVFLDELDKVAGGKGGAGPDVSREGVQRDLLPIVEGSTVQTKYGMVSTEHILFIAAGAFHVASPSDLIPELQGRFPIRVELHSLGEEEFVRILLEPRNALLTQYQALVATEGARLEFTEDGIREIARIACEVNESLENIGARRLHTVLTTLLEDVMYGLPESEEVLEVRIDGPAVRRRLAHIVADDDLRRYIL